jgi:maltooligosyltrehalose synthase
VLDVVPNHMGVLARTTLVAGRAREGRASRYAKFFDIDWQRGRKLLCRCSAALRRGAEASR